VGIGGLLALIWLATATIAQQPLTSSNEPSSRRQSYLPPRVVDAERFLSQRGWKPGRRPPARSSLSQLGTRIGSAVTHNQAATGLSSNSPAAATWQPLGPSAVITPNFGLVTGRVAAIALDPSDTTGNRLYIGTTGGGVWAANNAGTASASSIVFSPLTDNLAALGGVLGDSISIGSLTVQPGDTGVILAGTGDPNDALDSYYGAGILRSIDGGTTWTLVSAASDIESGISGINASFVGEGFAGFAWSTVNTQLVVAAVSQAYDGVLTDADLPNTSYEGLYYSSDSGATWHLATITDGAGKDVQGSPNDMFDFPDGNAATAVIWNPVRQLFIAAVRYHGYYQSADGITWTRMAAQPGAGLTTKMCPTNPGATGSIGCPIFRGVLAVNPQTGDTFAWTVDLNDQDQGLWQDQCAISGGSCANSTITFAKQWDTTPLETNTIEGAATIAQGTYNLVLAAVPSEQDTVVFAGANDLWKCSLAMGCTWRNTTNSTSCMSAQVGEFQHALAWNSANPLEMFVGNDSGLWRSTDGVGETGAACSSTDASHFQNLNGSLGSLAEVQSLPSVVNSPYSLMAGLGVNGFAGVKSSSGTVQWPQIFSGYGGPVAVDPRNPSNWFVNDQSGVAIYACTQPGPCTPSDFGTSPAVTDADVGGDGGAMTTAAPFLVDPSDSSQLLIGTCRVWRGPANGAGWDASNAISPILDSGVTSGSCSGDALIRSMAALPLANGTEVIYVGTYGSVFNGGNAAGHVFSATFNPSSGPLPTWTDLTRNPVTNSSVFNPLGFAVSSIAADSHDASGNTVYVTLQGIGIAQKQDHVIYRSTNGGATWTDITANLPIAPANGIVIDPQSANTVYVATDAGVFYTTEVANCAQALSNCWSAFGDGLPDAPVTALATSPVIASQQVLVAGTYGRGVWQTPLWTSATAITAASAAPANVAFTQTPSVGISSSVVQVRVLNTGSLPLTVSSIGMLGSDPGDFSETDNCVFSPAAPITVASQCTINVTFAPQVANVERTAVMTIYANVYSGQLTVDLTGTGTPAADTVTLGPNLINFDPVEVGTSSAALSVSATNSSASTISISSISITPPFEIATNSCGVVSLAPNSGCQIQLEFAPTQAGVATGSLTLTDAAGVQTVQLRGTGQAPPTDTLSPTSLTFPGTAVGQLSAVQQVTITNAGDLPLTSIAMNASAQFQATSNFVTQIPAHSIGSINVELAPTQVGAITGTLTVIDALRTQTVALSGTGLAAPAFSVNPQSLTFTNQQPGVTSAPQQLTITNSGGVPMANVGFQIIGPAASSYSVASTTCGAMLNNGASCTAQIVFTPGTTGVIAATLAVSSSTLGVAPVSVPLNGSGQLSAAALIVSPAQLNFATLGVGQSSASQSVTVTNSSSYAINSVSLSTNAPFSITQNTCTDSLAAGANCSASVVFQPSSTGSSSGVLTATSSSVAAPATVTLTGAGFDFAINVSGASTQTVARGQQANYTLVITPNGANGSFNFSCGTLPANAICLFTPTSESLNAGVQGNVQLEISTGASSTALTERPALSHVVPLAYALILLPLALGRSRRMLKLVLLAVVLAGVMTSCTSSGGGTGGTGGTEGSGSGTTTSPGTYSIPVTVTSAGLWHSLTLSLIVD
jgi:hypothetical protein